MTPTCAIHRNDEMKQALALVEFDGALHCPWCHPDLFGGWEKARPLFSVTCTEHDLAFEENEYTRSLRCPQCRLMCFRAEFSPPMCDKPAVFSITDPWNSRLVPTLVCRGCLNGEIDEGSFYHLEPIIPPEDTH